MNGATLRFIFTFPKKPEIRHKIYICPLPSPQMQCKLKIIPISCSIERTYIYKDIYSKKCHFSGGTPVIPSPKKEIRSSDESDNCILCGMETGYTYATPIGKRDFYIVGCGQLCFDCFQKLYRDQSDESNVEMRMLLCICTQEKDN